MSGILDLFVPKEKKFFEYLNKQVILLDETSQILETLVSKKFDQKKLPKSLELIQKKKVEVDKITLEVTLHLHKTFVTPIDRDEIKSLSTNLNLIVGSVEKIVSCVFFFKIKTYDNYFLEQVDILQESIKLLKYIFIEPLSTKRNSEMLGKISDLENKADHIYMKALRDLFAKNTNAVRIIRHKELYDATENAIDRIRGVADLLETIIMNNS